MFVNNNVKFIVDSRNNPPKPLSSTPASLLQGMESKIEMVAPQKKVKIHTSLLHHPAYAGPLRKEKAEAILSQHPIGAWLVRYSVSERQVVVTRKTNTNTCEHLTHINTENGNVPISSCSMSTILVHFDLSGLVFPDGGSLPAVAFSPLLKFTFATQAAFNKLHAEWLECKMGKQFKIAFQSEIRSIYAAYTGPEWMALANKYTFLRKYFGDNRYNIFNGYATSEDNPTFSWMGCLQDKVELLEEADVFLSQLQAKELDVKQEANHDVVGLVTALLQNPQFPGLLLGESHEHAMSKIFLIKHMNILKNAGVQTLFLEFLSHDVLQRDIDEYNRSNSKKMPLVLKAFLENLDQGFNLAADCGYAALVSAAKNAGIRIVALDSAASAEAGYDKMFGSVGPDRIKAFNYHAQKVIAKEANGSKYIALVGSAHVSTTYKIPGLSEIIGCPNCVLLDSDNDRVTVQTQVTNYLPQEFGWNTASSTVGGLIHYLIKLPKR